jgi:hypothetical protein
MPRLIFPSLTLIFAAFLAPATQASSITAFTDHTSWAAASGPLTTETFESLSPGRTLTPLVTLGAMTFRTGYPAGATLYPAIPFTAFPSSSSFAGSGMLLGPLGVAPYEVQFGGAWTLALGLDLVVATGASGNFSRPYSVTLVERDGSVTTITDGGTVSGPGFHGFTSALGIVQVIVSPLANGQGAITDPALDGVECSPVIGSSYPVVSIGPALPEPASVVTLSLGIMGVVVLRRRMRGNWRCPT